jgi:hypothetical protein
MFTRKSFLALATVTTLAAAALVPGSASARGFGGFGGGHFSGGQVGGFGGTHFGGGGHFGGLAHFGGEHFGGEHFGGRRFTGNHWDHGFHHPDRWTRCWADCYGWHRPHYGVVWGGGGGGGGDDYGYAPQPVADPGPAAQASAPCDCLTKKYLEDGSVLFTDTCTKEEALATPDELKAQAKGDYSSTK